MASSLWSSVNFLDRHGNELERLASSILQLVEERSTVDLKTLVHKVGLLHELMRPHESAQVVLTPPVESLRAIKRFKHSSVDVTVQSD